MNLNKIVYFFAKNPKAKQILLLRRERKRLKGTNSFAQEQTGERPVHAWMDPKRTRALAKVYEEQRNKHRFTTSLEKADKIKLKQLMDDYFEKIVNSILIQIHCQYYRRMQERYWLQKHHDIIENCKEEILTLPYLLRNEMTKQPTKEEKLELLKQSGDPYLRYQEQILRLMPEEEANNLLIARRLGKIASDSLTQGE